jgi:hypothetical protein
MYVPAKSPFEASAPLRAYLEREFASVSRSLAAPRYDAANVLLYGAVGDDSTDDTAAILAASQASRDLFFPGGRIYRISQEIYYNSDPALGPVHVRFGAGAALKTTGSNRAFRFDGAPVSTTSLELVLENVTIIGANSVDADCAIFLDQIALFWLANTVIFGNGKFTDGIYGHGAQQGEFRGGYVRGCKAACLHLDRAVSGSDPSGSNGIDIHGMSLSSLGGSGSKQFFVEETDSVFFHHNHMIGAEIGVDVLNCQSGCRISNNHIEAITGPPAPFVAGVRVRGANSQGVRIDGNVMFGQGPGLHIAEGSGITVDSNSLIACDLQYDSGTSYIRTINNYAIDGGSGPTTFTDNSTFGTKFGNRSAGAAFSFGNAQFTETVDFTDPRILILPTASLPAAGASQNGRVVIEDAGAGDRNFIVYAGGQRFRIDGGAAF